MVMVSTLRSLVINYKLNFDMNLRKTVEGICNLCRFLISRMEPPVLFDFIMKLYL